MIQGAQGQCTRMTERNGMGREVGGGSGWGTHVHPWWIHVNVWQNEYNIAKCKKKKLYWNSQGLLSLDKCVLY